MNNGQRDSRERIPAQSRRKRGRSLKYVRRHGGVNPGYIIFAVVVILILAVSLFFIFRSKNEAPRATENTADTAAESETPGREEEKTVTFIDVPTSDSAAGDLILVNYDHAYVFPEKDDLVNVYENKTDDFKVAYSDYMMDKNVLDVLISLTHELSAATGEDDLTVNSAYRTLEEQREIYDEYRETWGEETAKLYVADPGFSEHHTGIAADLILVRDDGTALPITRSEAYDEIMRLLRDHGFILRYPEGKKEITRIETEPWHFRYVGLPHSLIIEKAGLCFEEYIGLLKNFTSGGSVLFLSGNGKLSSVPFAESSFAGPGYAIYRVPAGSGETTRIPVPYGADAPSVSGDNDGGFIVTVRFGDVSPSRVVSVGDDVSAFYEKTAPAD
ncbi:MAG: M15 family metallopeptidase [Clostridia bacterium]|nr:M15 family metallopeptidase [Clostridia bacterium]